MSKARGIYIISKPTVRAVQFVKTLPSYNQTKRVDKPFVSERVQIAPRTFCEQQNKVRSTASKDVKFARSIYFSPFLWYNLTNRST